MITAARHNPIALAAVVAALTTAADLQAQACRSLRSVTVAPQNLEVRQGSSGLITVDVYDNTNNLCDATVTYHSAAPAIATVDESGTVQGVAVGRTTITVTARYRTISRQATVTVNVVAPVSNIRIVAEATPPPTGGQPGAAPVTVPPAVAGMPGSEAIASQVAGAGPAVNLVILPNNLTMIRNETRQLSIRALNAQDGPAEPVPVVFQVDSGASLINVDGAGRVGAGLNTGVAIISATSPRRPGVPPLPTRRVQVTIVADTVVFDRPVLSLSPGQEDTLRIVVPAQERREVNPRLFVYESSDTNTVWVSSTRPVIRGVRPGTAIIRASDPPYYNFAATVRVHDRVARVEVTPADSVLYLGLRQTVRITSRALAEGGNPIPEAPRRWTMPDTNLVTLDTATGTLSGRALGSTQFAIEYPGQPAKTIRVVVVAYALRAARERIGVPVGQRRQLAVELIDRNREPAGNALPYLRWTSSDTTVARVDSTGNVTGVMPGRALIRGTTVWDSTVTVEAYVAGDMIFSARRGGRRDIYMMYGENQLRPITQDTAEEVSVAWSRDLTRIAFFSGTNGRYDVWTANADGSGRTRLTLDSATFAGNVGFAGAEDELLIYESNAGGSQRVWLLGLGRQAGSRPLVTTTAPTTSPAVSPDGRRVALSGALVQTAPGRGALGLYVVNADGSGSPQLVFEGNVTSPVFAADGQYLYFVRSYAERREQRRRVFRQRIGVTAPDSAQAITPETMVVVALYDVSADGNRLAMRVQIADGLHTVIYDRATNQSTELLTPAEAVAGVLFRR